MELADVVASIRRHWKVSVGVLAAAVIIVGIFLVTRSQVLPQPKYQASVSVLIPAKDDKGKLSNPNVPSQLLYGQSDLARKASTLSYAFRRAGVAPDKQPTISLGVSQSETGEIISLSAVSTDRNLSERAANAYGEAYVQARGQVVAAGSVSGKRSASSAIVSFSKKIIDIDKELRAKNIAVPSSASSAAGDGGKDGSPSATAPAGSSRDVEQLFITRSTILATIRALQGTVAAAEVQILTPSNYAGIVERPPTRTVTPPPPSPVLPIGIAMGLGLLLALAGPVLIDRLDQTIKDNKTAAAILGAPVLTAIPPTTRVGYRSLAPPGSPHDAAYRTLAATSVATDRLPRAIMVTSPTGHVQDMVAANFASALASLGLKVALVATRPDQAWFLDRTQDGSDSAITFPDLLDKAHRGSLNGEVKHQLAVSELANLVIVPPGDTDDLALSLDGLPPLLAAFEGADIDVAVIAGPSLLDDPNATIFAWSTRSVLWAVETGSVTRSEAQDSAERLDLAGVNTFGVAMVGRET